MKNAPLFSYNRNAYYTASVGAFKSFFVQKNLNISEFPWQKRKHADIQWIPACFLRWG
jgi:hypothetical protein